MHGDVSPREALVQSLDLYGPSAYPSRILIEWMRGQCSYGKATWINTSSSARATISAVLGQRGSMPCTISLNYCPAPSQFGCVKPVLADRPCIVRVSAATTALLPLGMRKWSSPARMYHRFAVSVLMVLSAGRRLISPGPNNLFCLRSDGQVRHELRSFLQKIALRIHTCLLEEKGIGTPCSRVNLDKDQPSPRSRHPGIHLLAHSILLLYL